MKIEFNEKFTRIYFYYHIYKALRASNSSSDVNIYETALAKIQELYKVAKQNNLSVYKIDKILEATKFYCDGTLHKVVSVLNGEAPEDTTESKLKFLDGIKSLVLQNPDTKRNIFNDGLSLQREFPDINVSEVLSFLQELVTVDPSVNALDYVRLRLTGADRKKVLRVLNVLRDKTNFSNMEVDIPNYLRVFYALGGKHHSGTCRTLSRLAQQTQANKTTLTAEVDRFITESDTKDLQLQTTDSAIESDQ